MSPKLLNILFIILPVVLYYGYLEPKYLGTPGFLFPVGQSISSLQIEKVKYETALSGADLVEEKIKSITGEYKKIPEEQKQKIEKLLPDTVDPIKLRNEVKYIGNMVGVDIPNVSVVPGVADQTSSFVGFYTISFTIKGRYFILKNFIKAYEKNMRVFFLESAEIKKYKSQERGESVSDPGLLQMSIRAKVYYLK